MNQTIVGVTFLSVAIVIGCCVLLMALSNRKRVVAILTGLFVAGLLLSLMRARSAWSEAEVHRFQQRARRAEQAAELHRSLYAEALGEHIVTVVHTPDFTSGELPEIAQLKGALERLPTVLQREVLAELLDDDDVDLENQSVREVVLQLGGSADEVQLRIDEAVRVLEEQVGLEAETLAEINELQSQLDRVAAEMDAAEEYVQWEEHWDEQESTECDTQECQEADGVCDEADEAFLADGGATVVNAEDGDGPPWLEKDEYKTGKWDGKRFRIRILVTAPDEASLDEELDHGVASALDRFAEWYRSEHGFYGGSYAHHPFPSQRYRRGKVVVDTYDTQTPRENVDGQKWLARYALVEFDGRFYRSIRAHYEGIRSTERAKIAGAGFGGVLLFLTAVFGMLRRGTTSSFPKAESSDAPSTSSAS